MKTVIVLSENNIDKYYGQEFDFIVEVPNHPSMEDLSSFFSRTKMDFRRIWHQDESSDRKIVVTLGAMSPYIVPLINLKESMKKEEDIDIQLPAGYNKAD